MTDTWELYHQTGPDGQEWGVRVRPGYVVTGFAREDAESVVAWQNAAVSRPAGDVLERAKAIVAEYTTHNRSVGLLPDLIAEVERLRSAYLAYSQRHDRIFQKVIKRNKAQRTRIKELEAEKERLGAAFLDHLAARLYYEHYPGVSDAYSWHDYPEDACHSMPKEEFRKKAREALEKIRSGEK